MIFGNDNAVLLSDLDAQGFDLVNCGFIDHDDLCSSDDIRLYDPRPMVDGSVTNASVDEDAAIMQSKLSLDGTIPAAWLGAVNTRDYPIAAKGDLTEYVANKNVPNGYAGLDVNGRMLSSTIPPGPGSGTVSHVGFLFPEEFGIDIPLVPITTGGVPPTETVTGDDGSIVVSEDQVSVETFNVFWRTVPPICWFGLNLPDPGHDYPRFNEEPVSADKVPNLSGAQFTTGTFDPLNLPVAIGVGGTHSPGVVPDPGIGREGQPHDYLARDMTYKHMSADTAYQPTLSSPSITVMYAEGSNAMVSLSNDVPETNLFYSIGNGYVQVAEHQGFQLPFNTSISVYAAKTGWNNSPIFSDIILSPPIPGGEEEPPPTP